jgi:DNA mismatch endonuclease (patch repair protein)
MTDFLSPIERSSLMSRVRGKNTHIERLMFVELRKRGVRFSTHSVEIEGRPDIVIRKCRILVFVDGDFWHGRNYKLWRHKLTPSWANKIDRNIQRDRRQRARLRRQGWHVIRLWGSKILKDSGKCACRIMHMLTSIMEKIAIDNDANKIR